MAKIGKYSSSNEATAQPKMASGAKLAGATNMMSQFNTLEPRNRVAPTSTGAAKDPTIHRAMSQFSKR